MKKLVLFFAVAAGAIITSCDPPQNAWVWIVENDTEQPIRFRFPYSDNYQTETIMPGDNINLSIRHTNTGKRDNLRYDDLFERAVRDFGENVSWQITSENDEVLKTWNYSDKNLPDQRFFDESSWTYGTAGRYQFIEAAYSWTFKIMPEDIQLTN